MSNTYIVQFSTFSMNGLLYGVTPYNGEERPVGSGNASKRLYALISGA